ncbi:MAG: methylated-DNA--[protein]-cysteine S-methyltransferase [Armatimonadota bacterium]|nr:methylated-DNA--[protein]-cysteine S-methyltransferase [Fimbriimonadaceae bacterium]MCZ8139596.1 methylated-DNA--[protein]-cysteine S-methyltransferase [Fimbriimonadaceae bacterium]
MRVTWGVQGLRSLAWTDEEVTPVPAEMAALAAQWNAYWEGSLRDFDVPLELVGTEFQRRVWALVCDIPYGQTRTYGELALQLGDRNLSRAVGAANGANPVAVLVPCHRVIGKTGGLTGYAYGLDRKARLLAHESGERSLF